MSILGEPRWVFVALATSLLTEKHVVGQSTASASLSPLVSCLGPVNNMQDGGCTAAMDRTTCLRSRDGRSISKLHGYSIANEPCVWCGGSACTSNGAALCEPRDYLNGVGKTFASYGGSAANFEIASCSVPLASNVSCLNPVAAGCQTLTTEALCTASRDGRSVVYFEMSNIRIKDQPCVWCGGIACTLPGTSLCQPAEFLLKGAAMGRFNSLTAPNSLVNAHCPTSVLAPAPSPMVLPTNPTLATPLPPTALPTMAPTMAPAQSPTAVATIAPTLAPATLAPTIAPTVTPTVAATMAPTLASLAPTMAPAMAPTMAPTMSPMAPTMAPTVAPTVLGIAPTPVPSMMPTFPPTTVGGNSLTPAPTPLPSSTVIPVSTSLIAAVPTPSPTVAAGSSGSSGSGGSGDTDTDSGNSGSGTGSSLGSGSAGSGSGNSGSGDSGSGDSGTSGSGGSGSGGSLDSGSSGDIGRGSSSLPWWAWLLLGLLILLCFVVSVIMILSPKKVRRTRGIRSAYGDEAMYRQGGSMYTMPPPTTQAVMPSPYEMQPMLQPMPINPVMGPSFSPYPQYMNPQSVAYQQYSYPAY